MPYTADDAKPPILDEIAEIRRAQASWIAAGAVGADTGLHFVAVPLAAIATLALERQRISLERLLNDPPRYDFDAQTRIGRPRFYPERLGDHRLSRSTAFTAHMALELSAAIDAAVRADERAQGAALHDRVDVVERQLSLRVEVEREAAVRAERLAAALRVSARDWRRHLSITEPSSAVTVLPQGDLRALPEVRRSGLATSDLDPVHAEQLQGDLAERPGDLEAVERLADQTEVLAQALHKGTLQTPDA